MHGIAVALLTEDRDQLSALQTRLEATRLGRAVFSHIGFPAGPTDAILRQLQESRAEVVIVDVPGKDAHRAIQAIELIRATTQQIAIFANGEMTQPATIVASMRAGAGEYVDHAGGSEALLEALTRFNSSRTRASSTAGRAKVFTFLSAKGGSGCTTAAVNTALALQQSHRDVVLLDFAPIGHAALHLNLRPQFGVLDALHLGATGFCTARACVPTDHLRHSWQLLPHRAAGIDHFSRMDYNSSQWRSDPSSRFLSPPKQSSIWT